MSPAQEMKFGVLGAIIGATVSSGALGGLLLGSAVCFSLFAIAFAIEAGARRNEE